MKNPVGVIGVGLAGLAAAWELKDKALVLEASDAVGGSARTFETEGFSYDLGPHVLYFTKPEIKEWVEKILQGSWTLKERRARISIDGEMVDYPVQEGFLRSQRLKDRFLPDLLKASGTRGGEFQDTARSLYGKALAEDFFIPYNTKLWRYPLDEMDSGWAARFVPSFPKKDLELAACGKAPPRGTNSVFYYPTKGGIGTLAKAAASEIGYIYLNCEVTEVNVLEKWFETANGQRHTYSALISTIPLPELVKICVGLPDSVSALASTLKSVGMVFVHLGLTHPVNDTSHWVYFPDPSVVFHRLSIPGNYSETMDPRGKGSIVAEITLPPDEKPDIEGLKRRTKECAVRLGILKSADEVISDQIRILSHAYVFPTSQGEACRKELRDILESKGIHLAGRYAVWEYSNMESALAWGFQAAKKAAADL